MTEAEQIMAHVHELLAAARAVAEGGIVHRYDDHSCLYCDAYCPTRDEHHEPDCELIRLRRALAAWG